MSEKTIVGYGFDENGGSFPVMSEQTDDEMPDPDAPPSKSWWCDTDKVEVHERRCPHCGKLKGDRS